MNLVFFRGLNCRLACIINIANLLGAKYTDAFATLWSETDFADEAKYNIYASKRVYQNLKAMGIEIEHLYGAEMPIEEYMSLIPDGGLFVVGMDSFNIPWHPVYNNFHDPHFIFAKKETRHSVVCFDPVYDVANARADASDILYSAYELLRVRKVDAVTRNIEIRQEAESVLKCHPFMQEAILAEMHECRDNSIFNIARLLKQINAMIDNRYLFRQFLRGSAWSHAQHEPFFDRSFLSKWEAVRFGLYKASIVNENKGVIDEVCRLFKNIINEELRVAEALLLNETTARV